jgi:hypothetical protein
METTKEKFVREFTEAFAKFNIKITPLTFDEAFMTKAQKLEALIRTIHCCNDFNWNSSLDNQRR